MALENFSIRFTSRTVTPSGDSVDGTLATGVFLTSMDLLGGKIVHVMKIVEDGRAAFTFRFHTDLPGAIRLEGANKISLTESMEDNSFTHVKGTVNAIGYRRIKQWLDEGAQEGVVAKEDQMEINERNLERLAKQFLLNIPEEVDVELVLELETESPPPNDP